MKNTEIYFRGGFFRTIHGYWIPLMFEKFMIITDMSDEDKKMFFVAGIIGPHQMPTYLAGPFDEKDKAQSALDTFFMLGGMDGDN